MASFRSLTLFAIVSLCASSRLVGAVMPPAAADRIVDNRASVGSEFLQVLDDASAKSSVNFRSFVDPDTAVRVYHRDGGLLFAVTTTRNVTPREKLIGEREAAKLVAGMLQEKFRHLLDSDVDFRSFDSATLRVVFVEPDAYSPYIRSSWSNNGGAAAAGGFGGGFGSGAGGQGGGCSACAGNAGLAAGSIGSGQSGLGDANGLGWNTPRAFAPAGYWAGGSSGQAPCTGCR